MSTIRACNPAAISFDVLGNAIIAEKPTLDALTDASQLIRDGQCVAFPTETVYGLGAHALDPGAVARIFATKRRPADNPLIVHVASHAMLTSLLPNDYAIPPIYSTLMRAFWPGPLTLLFPANTSTVPREVTAGHPTVAVRMPEHSVARALIALANTPIAAPSANSSGKPSPTRAVHVSRDLGNRVSLVLDGGPCAVGLESTVLDGLHPDGHLRILRPGGVTPEQIASVLGSDGPRVLVHRRDYADTQLENAPTTPGMKYRHYSPAVPVVILRNSPAPEGHTAVFLEDIVKDSGSKHIGMMALADSNIKPISIGGIHWHVFPLGRRNEPAVTAQRLFDGLITLENEGSELILIEATSEENEGLAVMNRMSKAASSTRWIKCMTTVDNIQ